jgi:hypothetical protein
MRIPARFNGPPGSGNGGWSAGLFAVAAGFRAGGRPVEVTLRLPPPLETELTYAAGEVLAPDGALVAQVKTGADAGVGVEPVGVQEAVRVSGSYPGFSVHPFPTCFVCGPDRPGKDGLDIFPGPVADGRTAAPWTVGSMVDIPTVWAALDCPGGWTALQNGRTYVLGRIAVAVEALPTVGSTCVVVGAARETAGRKATVDTALYGPGGTRLAVARATWIAPTQ